MKTLSIIVGILLALSLVAWLCVSLFLHPAKPQTNTNTPQNSQPFGQTSDVNNPITYPPVKNTGTGTTTGKQTITLTSAKGGVVEVRNFSQDPDFVKDPANKGFYFLGYHRYEGYTDPTVTENPPYIIQYDDNTQTFSIALMQEPLFQTRLTVEADIEKRLNISQTDMCQLRYTITAPYYVNQFYAGENVLFSFCPGAVKLPQ